MAKISISKADLLKKLTVAKGMAEKDDARAIAQHHKDEAKALKMFRHHLATAMKWDYKTAKANGFEAQLGYDFRPNCPIRSAGSIVNAIAEVNMDSRDKYTLDTSHEWITAASWLPESKRPKTSVCD